MLHFLRVIVVVLAVVALVVPIAAASDCDDSHDVACATDCSCVCCCVSGFACHAKATVALAPIAQRAVISDSLGLEILLAADIFRPPTSV
jgi:hypothetical protein